MKSLLAIISIIIGINASFAQTKKPILINSFPNHVTKFSYITKDSINIRYKRLYKFTDFVQEKSDVKRSFFEVSRLQILNEISHHLNILKF